MSNSLCIVCDTNVSCHFFAVFVKMKDSRCAEEFVSASPILTGRIRTLDGLGSFGQKMSAIFFRTIWPQAMLQNVNTITAFSFVASPLKRMYQMRCNIFWKTLDTLLQLRRSNDVKVLEYGSRHITRTIFNH